MSEKTFKKASWVFKGIFRYDKNVSANFIQLNIESGEVFGDTLSFPVKNFRSGVVGGIYEVERSEPDSEGNFSAKLGSAKYVKKFDNTAYVMELEAAQKANELSASAQKLEADDTKFTEIFKALEPLRRKYQRTNAIGKRAIEVSLLHWLSKYE